MIITKLLIKGLTRIARVMGPPAAKLRLDNFYWYSYQSRPSFYALANKSNSDKWFGLVTMTHISY